jgi:hypothetical protein
MTEFKPLIDLKDLGVDLDEDSENFTEEEAASAKEATRDEFIEILKSFAGRTDGSLKYELKRRAGKYYSRVSCGEEMFILSLPWLKGWQI